MRTKDECLLNELAGAFHFSVGLANVFIAYYNAKKGSRWRAAFHLGLVVWEGVAFLDHALEEKEK